jgi:signal transduction protein with GAF and PtsI domain
MSPGRGLGRDSATAVGGRERARCTIEPIDGRSAQPDPASPVASPGVRAWADWIVESLKRDYQFQYCAVLVHEPADGALRLVGQRWGAGEDLGIVRTGEELVPLDGSVCGSVFRAAAPVLVNDVRTHPRYRSFPGAAMRSELAVPILVGDQAIGVINVESPRVGGFDIADLHKVVARAAEAAVIAPLDELAVPAGSAEG